MSLQLTPTILPLNQVCSWNPCNEGSGTLKGRPTNVCAHYGSICKGVEWTGGIVLLLMLCVILYVFLYVLLFLLCVDLTVDLAVDLSNEWWTILNPVASLNYHNSSNLKLWGGQQIVRYDFGKYIVFSYSRLIIERYNLFIIVFPFKEALFLGTIDT